MVDISGLDIIVNEILVIMKRVAIIAVALVKKLPADLEDIKLSCEAPIPNAPPSDFCKRIIPTSNIANITFIISKFEDLFFGKYSLYK